MGKSFLRGGPERIEISAGLNMEMSGNREALSLEEGRTPIYKTITQKLRSRVKGAQERWRFEYNIRGRLAKIDIYEIQNEHEDLVETLKFDYTISGKLKRRDGKPDLFIGQWGTQARLLLGK